MIEHVVRIHSLDLRDGTWEQQLSDNGDLNRITSPDTLLVLSVTMLQLLAFHGEVLSLFRFCMTRRNCMLRCYDVGLDTSALHDLILDKLQEEKISRSVAECFFARVLSRGVVKLVATPEE